MLKLSNTFYRFIRFTCDKVDKIHVRRYSQLNYKGKTCRTGCAHRVPHIGQLYTSVTLHKQQGKKRLKIRNPPLNLDDSNRRKPMSDPLRPTVNHASYGGYFSISNRNENNPSEDLQQQGGSASTMTVDEGMSIASSTIPLNFRQWEVADCGVNKSVGGNGLKFNVVSYNVLAQCLLEWHPYLYTQCAPHNLKWDIRALRLYEEIASYAPDILCLQEVQASHIPSFYSKFEQIGYTGIYKQKTGHGKDGCAIYFKKSVFELKDHISVEYYQPELPILNRDNIGIMVKLSPRELPDSSIVVATTHLLYNPRRTDVRLAQMQVLLAELDRFAYCNNGKQSSHHPIILTGDFNSTPDSVVITLLDQGHVSASPFRDESDWKRIGVTDNCQHLSVYLNRKEKHNVDYRNINIYNSENSLTSPGKQEAPISDNFSEFFNSNTIVHSLRLNSVYDKYKRDGSCEATTFQNYWVTVDYIYFSHCSSLKLVERLRLPTTTECQVLGSLPNDVCASDHLALAATFELRP